MLGPSLVQDATLQEVRDEGEVRHQGLGEAGFIEGFRHAIQDLRHEGFEQGALGVFGHLGTDLSLRELRPRQGRSSLRIVYAFAPARQAVLLIGGDKAEDPRFYRRIVAAAERIWREYLSS